MPNCTIANCKNSSKVVNRGNGNVSFHHFPNDPNLKEKWIDATGNKDWFPTKHSTICSIHFNEEDFVDTQKCRRLSKTAYPTIYILKMTTNEEEIIGGSPSNKATLSDARKRKLKKNIIQLCMSNEQMPLETRRLQMKLNRARRKIKEQILKIKCFREQNRRKDKKIHTLMTLIKDLKNK